MFLPFRTTYFMKMGTSSPPDIHEQYFLNNSWKNIEQPKYSKSKRNRISQHYKYYIQTRNVIL